jgi:hypothetical protein
VLGTRSMHAHLCANTDYHLLGCFEGDSTSPVGGVYEALDRESSVVLSVTKMLVERSCGETGKEHCARKRPDVCYRSPGLSKAD